MKIIFPLIERNKKIYTTFEFAENYKEKNLLKKIEIYSYKNR